jgi:thiamine transport system substrate-binding protein
MAASTKERPMVNLIRLVGAVLALLVAAATAQESPTLTVYTYDSFAAEWGPGPAIKSGFESQCGCTLAFVTTEDAITTLRRVQLEGASSTADVIVGLDNATASEARATGLFASHDLDVSGLSLPSGRQDETFVPFDYGYFAFVYKRDRVASPPRSFEELIAMPDDFKIVVQDPRSSTPGLGLVVWIVAAYGERAPAIWQGLKPHILTMTRGWSEAYALFLQDEADMAFSYTTSPAYHAIAENDQGYAAAEFTEGHIAQIELAGILAASRQQPLARQFLTYLVSPTAQQILPTTNWMYPVRELGAALPTAFPEPPAQVLTVDEAALGANARRWVDEALAALD